MYYVQFRKVYNDVSVSDWKIYRPVPPKMTVDDAIQACQLYMCRDFGMRVRLVQAGFGWSDSPFGNLWEIEDDPHWQFRVIEESEIGPNDFVKLAGSAMEEFND